MSKIEPGEPPPEAAAAAEAEREAREAMQREFGGVTDAMLGISDGAKHIADQAWREGVYPDGSLVRQHGADPLALEERTAAWRRSVYGPVKPPRDYALRALDEAVELAIATGATTGDVKQRVTRAIRKEAERGTLHPRPEAEMCEAAQVIVVLFGVGESCGAPLLEEVHKEIVRLECNSGRGQ